jgi:hypothetical protein
MSETIKKQMVESIQIQVIDISGRKLFYLPYSDSPVIAPVKVCLDNHYARTQRQLILKYKEK